MRARRTLLAFLFTLAFAAFAAPAAQAADSDLDQFPDETDNCPFVINVSQRDSDADGIGDACDATPFQSVDGHLSGGGRSSHPFSGQHVYFSFAIRRNGGDPRGTGRIVDGDRHIRIVSVDSFQVAGDEAVATGTANVDGNLERFILEVHTGTERYADRIDFVSETYSFGNRVEEGNLRIGS